MKYERILRAFAQTPLALMPEKAAEIIAFLELKAGGRMFSPDEIAARVGGERQAARGGSSSGSGNAIAVIPVFGTIMQRASMMTEISGGTSCQRVSTDLRQALANPGVSRIVLEFDSPGGGVYGVAELADEIRKSRGPKPIIAQVNSLAASAAYWLACSCDELICTPSGEVGSIGVYGVHEDWSKAYDDLGVKFTLVQAGKYKAEGVDYAPHGDEAAAYMQKRVDEYYTQFIRAVAKGRGVPESEVRNGFGEGRVVGASEAVKLKMADRVGTLNDTLARLGVKGAAMGPTRVLAAAPAAFDAEHDWRVNRNRLRQRSRG